MLKVYLSSTKADLQKYREAVSEILRAPLEFSVIDSYDAATGTVRETCLQDVATCDVYIGIIAWRYGHIPEDDDNPEGKSITELEYLRARETPGMERFLFMLDPAEPWPGDPEHDDTKNDPDGAGKKIKALRDTVLKDRAVLFKAQPEDLAGKVLRALMRWKPPPSWTKPYLVPMPERGHPIVGRTEVVEELWKLVLDGSSASLHFLPGVGKTTLALELVRDRARVLGHFEGVLWADLGSKPDYTLAYQEWAKALGIPKEVRDGCATDADWQSALRSAIGEHKLLIVLDDVWREAAAQTFVDLVPNGVFILTTRAGGTAFTGVHERTVRCVVPELSAPAARELIEALAPQVVRTHPREIDTLVKSVSGIPLALLLVGKYLRKASADGDQNRLRKAFQKMLKAGERFKLKQEARKSNAGDLSLKEIIEESYAMLAAHKEAQRAFLALSIFRPKPHHFTDDMAREVCAVDDDTIYELNDMGLLEYYGGPNSYTMHRVIAQFARDRLSQADSIALHRRAVDYFEKKLKDQGGPSRGEYLDWYRYEHADWQTLMDAWLYHLSHAGDEDGVMVAFVRRYFDAFWWWGYYQRFQFCEQMIDEWSPRRLREDFREALDHIQRFADSYPEGHQKRGRGDWGVVVDAILRLRRILKLEDGGANLARYNGRRVRAFTDFLLAEAYAYDEAGSGVGDPDKALAAYTLAHDRFVELGEPWVAAWILFYEADVRFDWGDSPGAALRSGQALDQTTGSRPAPERDPELIANLRRLQGDIALASGEPDTAIACYAAASFHAWMFQGIPEDADSYTMAFYREVTEERIATKLASLAATDPAQAEKLFLRLAEFWAPAREDTHPLAAQAAAEIINRRDAEEIAAGAFPTPLPEPRLREGAAEFAKRVRELAPRLAERLAALGIAA